MRALMLERGLVYVLRAEPNPFSKLLLFYPFAFRLSASVCRGAFVLFWKLGRQNERRFIGRAVCVAGVRLRCT